MAIDAVIVSVVQDKQTGDLIIGLGPRIYKDAAGNWGQSIPGQERIRIICPMYLPIIGQHIWGGSDTARLVDNVPGSKRIEYKRKASGALIEVY